MFETEFVDPGELAALDAAAASDALAASRVRVLAAEAEQLFLAAHWADLHTPEYVAAYEALLSGTAGSRGREGVKQVGAEGCPEMAEFAGAELAALLGRSTVAGEHLIADAVNLRHRHPLLWSAIAAGRVRVWLAAKAARRCAAVGLSREQAIWVDTEVAPYVETLSPGRFLALVEAKIREVDPAGAAERADAAAMARFVRTGATDEMGLRTLVARARAGDVVVFVAMLDRIAGILAERGDSDPVEVRRASALRVMADPAQALALLASAALTVLETDDPHDPDPAHAPSDEDRAPDTSGGRPDPADPTDTGVPAWWLPDDESTRAGAEAERWDQHRSAASNGQRSEGRWAGRPEESVEWMLDSAGQPLPPCAIRHDLTGPDARETAEPTEAGEDTVFRVGDRTLLQGLVEQLAAARQRLAPLCVFHVHTTRKALQDGTGVARVEELGPMVLAELRAWLTGSTGAGRGGGWRPPPSVYYTHADHASRRTARSPGAGRCRCDIGGDEHGAPDVVAALNLRLTPVLDPDRMPPVDRYEIPAPMRHALEATQPYDVFPFATQASRTSDKDHVVPYRKQTAGQTRFGNLAPVGRRHHRLKTHGRWRVHSPGPGLYWWRSPQGHWFDVGPAGTSYHGRDPDRDHNLPAQE